MLPYAQFIIDYNLFLIYKSSFAAINFVGIIPADAFFAPYWRGEGDESIPPRPLGEGARVNPSPLAPRERGWG
ncbi:MAG: hypothetical protein ANABAC_1407 [Anaerolineae bacterium]|nr:MAG: hypothetical protein ANABAC_1407 [Anaerolineae bacterium]